MDKTQERAIAAAVRHGLRPVLKDLGFKAEGASSFIRAVEGHECKIWLQKFRNQPGFRVAMTFIPNGDRDRSITEFGDKYTYADSPSGHKYQFLFLRSDDAVQICIAEIKAFSREVASQWFERHLLQVRLSK